MMPDNGPYGPLYRVRGVIEPGTLIDEPAMHPIVLAGLLDGIARRLIGSDLTVIVALSVELVIDETPAEQHRRELHDGTRTMPRPGELPE